MRSCDKDKVLSTPQFQWNGTYTCGVQLLVVDPGGLFWAKKDLSAWSISKGEYDAGEDPLTVTIREFKEERPALARMANSNCLANSGSRAESSSPPMPSTAISTSPR